jgi:hypothetical protein
MASTDPGGGDAASNAPSSSQGNTSTQARLLRRHSPTYKEEAIHMASGSVSQASKAKPHLVAKGYLSQGTEVTYLGLSLILFQIASNAKTPLLTDNIKAVAFLLEGLAFDIAADRIFRALDLKLENVLDLLTVSASKFEDLQQELAGNIDAFINTGTHLMEGNDSARQSLVEVTEDLQLHVEKIANAPILSAPASTSASVQPDTISNNPLLTYAAAAQRPPPLAHATAVARYDERLRQIVILPDLESPESQGLHMLSELELTTKAKLALDAIQLQDNPAPDSTRFVGAKKLAAGTIILDLNSTEAANWLRQPTVRAAFMQRFSATASFKDHEYRVLAEFVPVSFSPDTPDTLRCVESDSGAQEGSIIRAEWAKAPERRHALQRLAHLKLYFNSAEAANYAIRNGLYIAGKKVGTRRMRQEPQRCAKCQRYGHGNNEGAPHFAKDCKWLHDTCGGCGQSHRNSECSANLEHASFCVNCNERGHTVWDRNCPAFVNRCRKLNAASKDGDYLFFVTREASTWETTDPPPVGRGAG